MKISKEKLLESITLTEDDDNIVAPEEEPKEENQEAQEGTGIDNVGEASVGEIKQDVEASYAEAGVEVKEDEAEKYAKQIYKTAEDLNAKAIEYAAVNSANPDDVVQKLNACLKSGLDRWATAKISGSAAAASIRNSNLLIYGMPGFGKTAAVKAWCKSLGIYVLNITVSTLTRELIGGIPWPVQDPVTKRWVQKNVEADIWTPLFNEEKVIVFLDELNTSKQDVEATLLTFVAEHILPMVSVDANGKTITQTPFDNILFFVGAMNPPDPQLFGKTVHDLSNALDSRFNLRHEQKGDRKEFLTVL